MLKLEARVLSTLPAVVGVRFDVVREAPVLILRKQIAVPHVLLLLAELEYFLIPQREQLLWLLIIHVAVITLLLFNFDRLVLLLLQGQRIRHKPVIVLLVLEILLVLHVDCTGLLGKTQYAGILGVTLLVVLDGGDFRKLQRLDQIALVLLVLICVLVVQPCHQILARFILSVFGEVGSEGVLLGHLLQSIIGSCHVSLWLPLLLLGSLIAAIGLLQR